jgi:hypothetical protein
MPISGSKLPINLDVLLRQRTVEGEGDTEQELLSLAAKVPFDDCYNQSATASTKKSSRGR